MLNKKLLLPLLAFAGALFLIYSIAQASNTSHRLNDTLGLGELKAHCYHNADNSHQNNDDEQAHSPESDPNEESIH